MSVLMNVLTWMLPQFGGGHLRHNASTSRRRKGTWKPVLMCTLFVAGCSVQLVVAGDLHHDAFLPAGCERREVQAG